MELQEYLQQQASQAIAEMKEDERFRQQLSYLVPDQTPASDSKKITVRRRVIVV